MIPPQSPWRRSAWLGGLLTLLVACDLGSSSQSQTPVTQTSVTQTQTTTTQRDTTRTQAPAGQASAGDRDPASGLRWVAVGELPREGQAVLRAVARGGPFPYSKDGTTFGNRERLLPAQARGYYREYTVKTPGESDRGARRIVCGGAPKQTAECYYTADHYASFRRIRP